MGGVSCVVVMKISVSGFLVGDCMENYLAYTLCHHCKYLEFFFMIFKQCQADILFLIVVV